MTGIDGVRHSRKCDPRTTIALKSIEEEKKLDNVDDDASPHRYWRVNCGKRLGCLSQMPNSTGRRGEGVTIPSIRDQSAANRLPCRLRDQQGLPKSPSVKKIITRRFLYQRHSIWQERCNPQPGLLGISVEN
jgi:hypothetical protein